MVSMDDTNIWAIVAGNFYCKYMNCKMHYEDPIMRYHYGYELLQYSMYYYQMYRAAIEIAECSRRWHE